MSRALPTSNEVLTFASEIISAFYPEADSAFVAGSFMRGQGSLTSDIDLVVLHPSLPQAYRESFVYKGIPVEAFVHDPETLSWFLESDRREGHPALVGMLVEGTLIGPRQQPGRECKQRAAQIFADGPPLLATDALQRLRYAITDKLDDLAVDRTPAERVAIGAALYPLLAELALRGSNQWNGSGKWTARLLSQWDPSIALQFERAFLNLYSGSDSRAVIELAEHILKANGGRLFSGYRSDAPPECRSVSASPKS